MVSERHPRPRYYLGGGSAEIPATYFGEKKATALQEFVWRDGRLQRTDDRKETDPASFRGAEPAGCNPSAPGGIS